MSNQLNTAYNSNGQEKIPIQELTGEAKRKIDTVLGKEMNPCGGNTFTIQPKHIYGRGHNDGVKDADGRKWWLTIKCPECKYHLNYKKWSNHL